MNFLNKTIYKIYSNMSGKKFIHFYGYFYKEKDNDYHFVSYINVEIPMSEAIANGFSKTEENIMGEATVIDYSMTEEQAIIKLKNYNHGDFPVETVFNKSLDCGIYINN